jgi:hypothetical protein
VASASTKPEIPDPGELLDDGCGEAIGTCVDDEDLMSLRFQLSQVLETRTNEGRTAPRNDYHRYSKG